MADSPSDGKKADNPSDKKKVDNSRGRKKMVIVSLLAFLLLGGGVFLFFIIQGSNDITGTKNANFHYGSVVRESMAPFFKYFGLDEEKKPRTVHSARVDKFVERQAENLDMSGWLNKNPGGAGAAAHGGGGGRNSAAAPSAVVPRMNGRGGGGIAGGGGSQSSGGASRFSGGSDKGNTKITAASSGGAGAGSGGKILDSLRGARAMLGTGLRSGSAMTAKSSWDKSFGVGTTAHGGKVSGDMSYGSNGLAQLDTIKSGDISSLKTTDPAAATSPGASPPALDKEATKAASDAMTDVVKSVAQNAISKGASLLGGGGGGTTPKSSIVADPPPDIKAAGEKTIDQPGGWHCATACDASPDAAHPFVAQDSSIIYSQTSNTKEWVVTYKGEYSIPAAPPATPTPYANYEQSFIVQPDHSLKPMNDGTCVMANGSGNCPELDAVPTGP